MLKVKDKKVELERVSRRRSLPLSFKNYDLQNKSERSGKRKYSRHVSEETSAKEGSSVKRKRTSLPPARIAVTNKKVSSKKLGEHKKKVTNVSQKKKKRLIVEPATSDETKKKIATDENAQEEKVEVVSGSEDDDKPLRPAPKGNKLLIRSTFLMRKLKRESATRNPQKYETERTDYIKEDRPSFIDQSTSRTKDGANSDNLTSSECSPKLEHEPEGKLALDAEDGDENKGESHSATTVGGKVRVRNESATHRAGINFQVGGRLEARDYLNMWYPSRIIQVDAENREILIHFERWNSRFDEWVSMDSPRLRPITRSSSRKDNRGRKSIVPKDFRIGEIVYAKWSDCKTYPAKILKVNLDETYTVLFYDGFERVVQFINVKKLPPEFVGKVSFKPSAMKKVLEERQRKLLAAKASEPGSVTEPGISQKPETLEIAREEKPKEVSSSCDDLSSSKVTPGIAPIKRNKLLVGGIFQAKRQQLKVKIGGGGAMSKVRKQPLEKSTSGRSTPTDKEIKPIVEDKTKVKASISNPLLVQELSKAPLYDPYLGFPTKAFLIEEDHNHFKCTVAGCGKSFRKDVLLASHMKHYHSTPKSASGGSKKPSSLSEFKDEEVDSSTNGSVPDLNLEVPGIFVSTPTSTVTPPVEGNLERKMITEKRRQLLMQKKLDSMSKKKEQHLDNVIASVAKKCNPNSPDKLIPDTVLKEITPKLEKPKSSPKKRRYFFTTKVMSKFRRMKMASNGQKITNGQRIANYETQEELINCCCERCEEDGLMMQCEVCLAWQHGACFGIEDEKKVPDKYICYVCKNPKGIRNSFRYCYNQDWYRYGELASFKCFTQRDNWCLRNKIFKTHGLAAQTLIAGDVLHTLRYKLNIAKNISHPELKHWSRRWARNTLSSVDNKLEIDEADEKTGSGLWGFSDHCYSVPNQEFSNESLVDPNGIFFNDNSKGLCFDVAANEEVLEMERPALNEAGGSTGGEISNSTEQKQGSVSNSAACKKGELSANDIIPDFVKETDKEINNIAPEPLNFEAGFSGTCSGAEKEALNDFKINDVEEVKDDPQIWQLNLLDHIENIHLDLDSRLDDITRKLEVLEAEYDYSDLNISKDPQTECMRTKRLLSCITNDLVKVRRMALYR